MTDSKTQLRQSFMEIRESLSPQDVERKSDKLIYNLRKLISEFEPHQIFLYRSHKNEPILDRLKEVLSFECSFALPKIQSFKDGKMAFYPWKSNDPLKLNKIGLEEPSVLADVLTPDSKTVVCVPAVALDRNGVRMGYGGGFYDRFFEEYPNAIMVGVVFEDFLVKELPLEAWDVPMNYVCTDASVIHCS